jgi:hypothetical protein
MASGRDIQKDHVGRIGGNPLIDKALLRGSEAIKLGEESAKTADGQDERRCTGRMIGIGISTCSPVYLISEGSFASTIDMP